MEAEALYQLNKALSSLVRTPGKPGDLESVLQHIAETAENAFDPDICVIRARNPITAKFLSSPVTVGDLQVKDEALHENPRPEGITQLVLKDGEVYIEDLEDEDKRRYHNRFTLMEGICAVAGLALRSRHRKRPLGVIYLNFRQPRKFSATERESYQLFAVQASVLVQEARLAHNYEEVARIGQEVNQNLSTVDDLFKVLQTYVDTVLDESHTLLLAVYQPQTNRLDVHIRSQEHSTRENMPLQGACEYVFETQRSQYIKHLSKEAKQLPYQVINIAGTEEQQSFIFVPLLLRDECLGVLSIQHPSPKAYGQEDLFVLQLLANYIALALHNMRLYNSLNQLNETGQLLTQQLESDQTLQATADKIHEATQADVVVLYPYELARQRFVLPPLIAGEVSSSREQMSSRLPNDIVRQALQHELPIFAKQGITLYTALSGRVQIRRENFQRREQIRSTAMIPLKVGDEKVGVLFVNFRQAQRFDATQKLFIEGLAHYAAIAIKNSQKYGTLIQRRIQELEILQNIDRELSRTLDLKSLLNTLLRLAYEQVHADEAAVLLYNSRTQALEVPAAIGANAESRRKDIISLQATKYITRWVLEHKKPARVDNVHRDPQWQDIYIQGAADTISELDVPLLDGEEAIGVLNFESTREGAFGQEDEHFLVTLAGQAVLAIKNAQAYEREKRLAEEGQVLNEISKEIIGQLDHVHVFDLILEKALELTNSTLGSVHIYHAELNELEMVAERGVAEDMKRKRQGLHEGIVGYVAKHRHFLNVGDVSQAPWDKIYVEFIPGTRSELAAPMLAGNTLWGVLNIESPHLNNFSESDERLLQGLADLAVIALQNAHAYEREKRLAEEAQVLNHISKEITSQLDLARVFDLIIEKALELTHSNLGSLMLYNADRNDLYMVAEHGVAEDKKGARQSLDEGIVGYVATHKRLLNVVDVSQHPWNEIYLEFIPGTRSELAVPMLAGNELRGVLNVESFMPNHFSESEERLLQGLADLAVVALQNAQAYEREKRIADERQLLNEISKEITSQFDHMRVFDLILKKTLELTRSTIGALLLYAPESQDLRIARQQGLDNDNKDRRIGLDEGIVGYVATHKKPVNIGDVSQPDWKNTYLELFHETRSELAVPMLAGDELRGVINVESTSPHHFTESDKRLLEGLADLAVVALQNAEHYNQALAAKEMSSIGEFALGLTHRLGSNLGLFEAYIDNIREELKEHQISNGLISRKLEQIQVAVRKVLDMSEELQSKLTKSSEAMEDEPVVIALEDLCRDAKQDIGPLLPSDISLEIELEDEVAEVRVHPRLVIEILRDLVINAKQAMEQGGKITLKARNIGHDVALDVSDTGIGIPPENQAKIFRLFYSTKRSFGFGLWFARRNAKKNGGDLKMLESQPGRGTTFRLSLPKAEDGVALRR